MVVENEREPRSSCSTGVVLAASVLAWDSFSSVAGAGLE
jgi:hypothetical protein